MDEKTTKSVQAGQKSAQDSTTQRYLPFSEIRDNVILMKDGSSRMALRVQPVNFYLKSEEEQDSLIYSFQRFLNSLRFPVQIIVRSLKMDIESYIYKLKNLALKQANPLLQEQTYRYIDFLTNLIDLAQIMKKEFYIVIPFDYVEGESVRKKGIVGIFQNFWSAINQQESVGGIREKRRRFEDMKKGNLERLQTIKISLEGIGIRSDEVKKDELLKFLISYYNPKVNSEVNIK